MSTYALTPSGAIRLEDGANIPNAAGNADWMAYQAWLAAGGVPRPLPPDDTYDWNGVAWVLNAPRAAVATLAAALGVDLTTVKANTAVTTFLAMSPAQVSTYVTSNVTGLNAASVTAIRTILITLGQVLVVIARDRINNT